MTRLHIRCTARQTQASAFQATPVLLNGLQTGGGLLGRTPHELQMTAVPAHAPPEVVAVKDTWASKAPCTQSETAYRRAVEHRARCACTQRSAPQNLSMTALGPGNRHSRKQPPCWCKRGTVPIQQPALLTWRVVSTTEPGSVNLRH